MIGDTVFILVECVDSSCITICRDINVAAALSIYRARDRISFSVIRAYSDGYILAFFSAVAVNEEQGIRMLTVVIT